MKIAIVVGGRWHAFDLAQWLERKKVLGRLITNYPKFKTRQWGIPDQKVTSLLVSFIASQLVFRFGWESAAKTFQHQLHAMFAHPAARRLKGMDLVHGFSSSSEPSIDWCRQHHIPFVLERGSSHMLEQTQILEEEKLLTGIRVSITHPKIIEQELREYEKADRISVVSRFVYDSFVRQGVKEEKLFYNPLGVNLSAFFPGQKVDNRFRVIYAGALSLRKGIGYLVKSFHLARIPQAELLLVGGASWETPQLLKDAGPEVVRTGKVPQRELTSLYHRADVFAIASVEEGMAMVVPQAMACGLAVVCSANTGAKDVLEMINQGIPPIEHGKILEYSAGYIVPPRDTEAMGWCLARLAADADLLMAKRKAALLIHERKIDWEAYADRSIALYREMLHISP